MSHQNGSSDKRTVVDEGTSFKGTLSSSCPIDVRGRIEGDVETPSLTISQSGAVHGRVKVGSVRSEGEIAGEFDADHVELAGSVKDNTVIRARSLEVRLATERGKRQVIFGECELSVGDEPTEHIDLPVPVEQTLSVAAPPSDAPVEAPAAAVTHANGPASSDVMLSRDAETVDASVAAPAAPADETSDEDEDEGEDGDGDDDASASAAPAEAVARKRRRGRKSKNSQNGQADDPPLTGWSQPPSQPPPAS